MLYANPRAVRAPYPDALRRILNAAAAAESGAWLARWPLVGPDATPLWTLPGAAARLGVAQIALKDEARRSPLGSFKALGAPVALLRLILRLMPAREFDPAALMGGRHAAELAALTVISATDGNHGRALAAAAQAVGCACVIVLHAHVSAERERAIAAYGARIVRIAGNYDASVEHAARLAAEHGWHVVSDTSYAGYEAIPRDVMQGYGVIAAELEAQLGPQLGSQLGSQLEARSDGRPCVADAFTHVFLQGGVGGLAAGVASHLWERCGARRPRFVVVEPRQADCLLQSAIAGRAARAGGSVDSVMAGLACGEASPLAWQFLQPCVDHFLTIEDDDALDAVRALAAGRHGDVPIVAGESGAAGYAGLAVLMRDPALAARAGLAADSRVLLINTEGATAPDDYAAQTGERAEAVAARQRAWLAARA